MSDRIEVYDEIAGYIEQAPGPDGPTHFVRLGTERITPRAAGDLITDPNITAIDWDTGWIYPTLLNGWVNYGSPFSVARYRKSGGVVFTDGLIKSGTITADAWILPTAYRPKWTCILPAVDTGNVDPERLDIRSDGGVRPQTGSNGWFTTVGSFYADYEE